MTSESGCVAHNGTGWGGIPRRWRSALVARSLGKGTWPKVAASSRGGRGNKKRLGSEGVLLARPCARAAALCACGRAGRWYFLLPCFARRSEGERPGSDASIDA